MRRRARRGGVLIYCTVLMTALIAMTSLAVDLGRVQVAKTEMRRAATAAARAAAVELSNSLASVQTTAQTYAAANKIDGSAIAIDPNSDVEVGTWDTTAHTFTAGSFASANAVRITLRRTAARGNALPLIWASVLGKKTFDVTVDAVATVSQGGTAFPGICGLNSFSFDKTLLVASYNSGTGTSPSISVHNNNGVIGSNGAVGASSVGASQLWGTLMLGPSGTVSGNLTVHTSTQRLSSAIVAPASTAFNPPQWNPLFIPPDWTVSNFNITLPGGTYYFTSVNIDDNVGITFSGPATVYVDGNVTFHDNNSVRAYRNVPSNLVVYQSTGHSFTCHNNNLFVAQYECPGVALVANDDFTLQGSMIFKTVSVHDGAEFYFDEALGPQMVTSGSGGGTTKISAVK